MLKYADVKGALYVFQTIVGLIFVAIAWSLLTTTPVSLEFITIFIQGFVLLVIGAACVLFGVETFFLRDDPDVWR